MVEYNAYAPGPTAAQEQGFAKKAMDDWALQYNPQLTSIAQQKLAAQNTANQGFNANETSYQTTLKDLAAANLAQRNAAPEEYNLRGLYNSGIMATALEKIGQSYLKNVGNAGSVRSKSYDEIAASLSSINQGYDAQNAAIMGTQGQYLNSSVSGQRDAFRSNAFAQLQYENQLKQQAFENSLSQQQMSIAGRSGGNNGGYNNSFPDGNPGESDMDIQKQLSMLEIQRNNFWSNKSGGISEKGYRAGVKRVLGSNKDVWRAYGINPNAGYTYASNQLNMWRQRGPLTSAQQDTLIRSGYYLGKNGNLYTSKGSYDRRFKRRGRASGEVAKFIVGNRNRGNPRRSGRKL